MADAPGPSRLEVRDLTVSYGGAVALRNVTFGCGPGEVLGIVGPNGAGKSTLLKAIMGEIPADAGEARLGDRPLAARRRVVAYLPQRSAVDWDYPAVVEEVVAMGRYPFARRLRGPDAGDRAKVADALARVGLTPLARRPIGELSGGQQQRMLLARALAQEAVVLLLDEPFSGVDAPTAEVLWHEIRRLRGDGRTILVVNHDLNLVHASYDKLLVLARRVIAFGPVAEVFTPGVIGAAYGGVPTLGAPR
jgi:ABC-type Mn2+/Zn2+ transport system ATPase subunit